MVLQLDFGGFNKSYALNSESYMSEIEKAVLDLATEIYLSSQYERVAKLFGSYTSKYDDLCFWAFTENPTWEALICNKDFVRLDGQDKAAVRNIWQAGNDASNEFRQGYEKHFSRLIQTEPHAPHYALAQGFLETGLLEPGQLKEALSEYAKTSLTLF